MSKWYKVALALGFMGGVSHASDDCTSAYDTCLEPKNAEYIKNFKSCYSRRLWLETRICQKRCAAEYLENKLKCKSEVQQKCTNHTLQTFATKKDPKLLHPPTTTERRPR